VLRPAEASDTVRFDDAVETGDAAIINDWIDGRIR
jgi:hypothetical protein